MLILTSKLGSSNQVADLSRITQGHGLYHESTCGQVTAGAGLSVNVGAIPAGAGIVNGTVLVAVAASTNFALTAADVTNPRRDVIWVDTTGTIGKTDGTAAAAPARPAITASRLALAEVYVAAGATSLVNGNMTDGRNTLAMPRLVKKTANETVNTSAVLQNDDHFFFSIFPNEVWEFDMVWVFSTAGATPGFQCTFTVPASATGSFQPFIHLTPGTMLNPTGAVPIANTFSTSGTALLNATTYLKGIVFNSSTAGTVQFQWAQAVSNASDTIISGSSTTGQSRLVARRLL